MDGYPNLSDGLKGRLKNTASENHADQPPIGKTEPSHPIPAECPHLSGRFRNSNPPTAKLINAGQKHQTAAFRANPKHCGVAAGFPAKAAMGQNLYSNRSTIHHPGQTRLADLSGGLSVISK
ncbi:TPA: hypothetical protein ACFNMH_001375 [Neisseria elongata]